MLGAGLASNKQVGGFCDMIEGRGRDVGRSLEALSCGSKVI